MLSRTGTSSWGAPYGTIPARSSLTRTRPAVPGPETVIAPLPGVEAGGDGAAVGGEVLGAAEGGHRGRGGGQGVAVVGGHLHGAQEVEGGQPGGEPGRAGGREDVVGAGGVVAKGDRGPGADEHAPALRTCRPARRGRRPAAPGARGERLGHGEHGLPVVAEHGGRLAGEGGLDPVAVGGGRHLPGQQRLDRLPQVGVVGDQQAGGQRVVLGLGDQVDGDQQRVGGGVGQHRHLGRAGEPVDADPAGHLPLGQGGVQASGPVTESTAGTVAVPQASAATA